MLILVSLDLYQELKALLGPIQFLEGAAYNEIKWKNEINRNMILKTYPANDKSIT